MKTMVHRGLLLVILSTATGAALASNGVVSSPCNETSFNTVLTTVQSTGGGTITFNCGGAATITFSAHLGATRQISQDVVIDGANLITFDGSGSNNFFQVFSGKNFTLKNLTLQHGALDGGVHAIESFGNLTLNHVAVSANSSIGSAVLINSGAVTVLSSTFTGNSLVNTPGHDDAGAAIQIVSADTAIFDSTFTGNTIPNTITTGKGGAIAFGGGTLNITRSAFSSNQAFDGGAIQLAAGAALIERSTFTNNQAVYGGAIENDGASFDIKLTTFSTNTATTGDGGAIWHLFGSASALSSIDQSQFTGNQAGTTGGAVSCYSGANNALNVLNSTFSGNTSGTSGGAGQHGGAIFAGCQFYSENSTYYNNTASSANGGGALFHTGESPFYIYYVTVAGNKAGYGGIANSSSGVYTPRVGYSIITANTVGATTTVDNCAGSFASDGYNVSDGGSCGGVLTGTGDLVNVTVAMQTFGNHGGPTSTLPPASGNPGINRVPNGLCFQKDQRGALRPASGSSACDSGAFEVNGIIDEIFKDAFEAF